MHELEMKLSKTEYELVESLRMNISVNWVCDSDDVKLL